MIIGTLLTVILYLGAGVLAGLLVYVAVVTLKTILSRITNFLRDKFRGTVGVWQMERVANDLRNKAQKEGNITQLNDLLAEVDKHKKGKDGLFIAEFDQNGKIAKGGLQILDTDELDGDLKDVLNNHNGELIVTNSAA